MSGTPLYRARIWNTRASSTEDPPSCVVIPCVAYINICVIPSLYSVSIVCQVELENILNVGVRDDSAQTRALSGLVLCLRFYTVILTSLPPLTNQRWFAATVC